MSNTKNNRLKLTSFGGLSRSQLMARITSFKNASTELKMVVLLRDHGLTGWRRHYPILGRPDFTWPAVRVALFVDGCFWHGCPRHYETPKSNIQFWRGKVMNNKRRDRKINEKLRQDGWTVLRVWECRIHESRTAKRIIRVICRIE